MPDRNPELAALDAELQPALHVLRLLGSGDTSDVYLAREPSLQRLVAVKVLRQHVAANETARLRFEREARSIASITHPNVTAVHRVGRTSNDVPYMVMEYVDGRTLRDIIESGSALDCASGCAILASVAGALAAAHERGIIHRDVRADNVFVENRTERAVLGDFGIAARLDSGASAETRLTAAGMLLGKTHYVSPEHVRGEPVTEQSDIYSFGILAYEVLAGRGPYAASGDAQMLMAHLQGRPLPLQSLRPEVDVTVASTIERCLSREPNRRPRAQELVRALAPGQAAPASPDGDGPLAQFLAELRRRRVYRVLAAYGAFALAVFGVAQGVDAAFPMSRLANQILVVAVLAGFPLSLTLSWVYDINAGRIRRTRAVAATSRARSIMWLGLAGSVAVVAVLGWLLLRGR
ncbi:MAG TPA: serine/threonine-protein kinase [Longimicrobiales bacterium]|nr:serine/threonine-protein kinase [Longimicrobiales bacterium]